MLEINIQPPLVHRRRGLVKSDDLLFACDRFAAFLTLVHQISSSINDEEEKNLGDEDCQDKADDQSHDQFSDKRRPRAISDEDGGENQKFQETKSN